ncbi:hypothetical protein CSB20_11580 [bacterium DOLZORAL124_64_63]|nr:MAG: hypothetical protein CSB20_11580 [bacterium DOLZORAL124_64_63]
MFGLGDRNGLGYYVRDPRSANRLFSTLGHILIFGLAFLGSHMVVQRMGLDTFVVLLVLAFVGSIYALLSFRNMSIPLAVWLLSIGGFRFLFMVPMAGLPDLYLDRLAMIWLTIIFMIKFFAESRKLRGPFILDALIILHGTYILTHILILDSEHFNLWTKSYLTPYAAYFLGKNIVVDFKRLRLVFLLLLLLAIYYNLTSIAEKFDLNFLLWPKYMRVDHEIFRGRSNGPFRHAPLFGTIIGMLIPLHLYFITAARNYLVKFLLYLSLGLSFGGLYFTYTRGSWLVGITALSVAVALNRRHYLRLVAPLVVLAPILAVSVLGIGQDQFLKERVENENTLDARAGTILTALRVWRDHPFTGCGFFQYPQVRLDYVEALEVPILGTLSFRDFRHNAIHDIYFGPLAEEGLIGVSLQLIIYFLIFRTFRRKFSWRNKGDPFATYVMPVFAGIFVGYLVGGIAIDYRFFSVTGTLFFMTAGILYGYEGETPVEGPLGGLERKSINHSTEAV